MSDERRLTGEQFLAELTGLLVSGERVVLVSEVGVVLGAFQQIGGLWVLYPSDQAQRIMEARAQLRAEVAEARRGLCHEADSVEDVLGGLGLGSPTFVVSPDEVGGSPEKTAAVAEMAQSASEASAATFEEVFPEGGKADSQGNSPSPEEVEALQVRLALGLQTIGGEPVEPFELPGVE